MQEPKLSVTLLLGVLVLVLAYGIFRFTHPPQPDLTGYYKAQAISHTLFNGTDGWSTYSDVKYSYTVKYPGEYESHGDGIFTQITPTVPAAQYIIISVFPNPGDLEIKDWLASDQTEVEYNPDYIAMHPLPTQNMTLNGNDWLNFADTKLVGAPGFPPSGTYYWAALHNHKIYLVGDINIADGYGVKKQMLGTFRFTDE
jgi:hypothetical protein